jgi:PAS domain S-box-containing protein
MASRMRSFDWSTTPLGPPGTWPASLRVSLGICLASTFPVQIWWGPHLTLFYNDACIPFLGASRHPAALGGSGRDTWKEIWETVEPTIDRVFIGGPAGGSDDLLVFLDRELAQQETYVSFSFSPVFGESGSVDGIFCASSETTEKVVGNRRLETLRGLAVESLIKRSLTDACTAAGRVLAANPYDIPFAALYVLDDQDCLVRMYSSPVVFEGAWQLPDCVLADASNAGPWPFASVVEARRPIDVALAAPGSQVLAGAWPERLTHAVVLPIRGGALAQPAGVLIAGVSTRRPLDERYRAFLDLVAGSVAAALADARVYQQEEKRARADAAMRESEEWFRLMANSAPVTIWMTGVDKGCTYVNQAWIDFTGRPLDAALGSGWSDGIHRDDLERSRETYTRAFDRHEPFQMEYRVRRHDGEFRWVIDTGAPRYTADGSFAGYIGSAMDITERWLAEEALSTVSQRLIDAQEEERSRLARELHDDISQRLGLLSLRLSELAQASPPSDAELNRLVSVTREEVVSLVKDVHGLSHRLHPPRLQILGLAAAADALCEEFSNPRTMEVSFQAEGIPKKLPPRISLCLYRVLQESLQNAAKHSGARHVHVSLTGGADRIELTVHDSGNGFDPDDAVRARGLGLTSMKERMKGVHGQLVVDSDPQSGTRIRARVPHSAYVS